MIVMLFAFSVMLVPLLFMVLALGWLTRCIHPAVRTPLLVLVSVLLLTPSLGPATIAIVPVPIGYLVIATAIEWSWRDLVAWVGQYPLWHTISIPATALISYIIVRLVRPNDSFKPPPLRGAD